LYRSCSSVTRASCCLPSTERWALISPAQTAIHKINEETADDVRSWVNNANSLQADILRTKSLANDIVKQAEAPVASGEAVQDAEVQADFLVKELNYNRQLNVVLKGIKRVSETLDQAETARDERRLLDALRLLEDAWKQLDDLAASKSCRAIRLLHMRAFELKSSVHGVLEHIWQRLVHVDLGQGRFSVNRSLPGGWSCDQTKARSVC
jgi:centromere/kinetochore protein ZW10